MKVKLLLAAVTFLPAWGLGQGVPGTNIVVDVKVATVVRRADTVRIEYLLTNRAQSAEHLFSFTVEAPSPVGRILRPEPKRDWKVSTQYRTRSVARWTVLGEQMAPGEVSPQLAFEAIGLPTIVAGWVGGYFPPPPLVDTLPIPPPDPDPLVHNSVPSQTVGVEPFPADLSPANLLQRLRALTDETCGGLGWITNAGVCSSLQQKLEQAGRSLAGGQVQSATGQLHAFLNELTAQHGPEPGKHVTGNAYWLLKVNAEYLLSKL